MRGGDPVTQRNGMALSLRLSALRYRVTESLFVVPALVMLVGILLAVLAIVIDEALGHDAGLPGLLAMNSNAAMWLLATVAGAMIATVGVVFSLTVVSLQLASNQFSPRVMRSFIRDRVSQGVIGLLVGTFFYCVLILPSLSGEPTDPAPQVSLTVAVALTVVTVVGIIAHLDHLSRSLQVGEVVRSLERETESVVTALSRVPNGLRAVDPKKYPPPAAPTSCCRRRADG